MTLPVAAQSYADTALLTDPNTDLTPTRIMEVELTRPLPRLSYDVQYQRVWILGRLHTEPVGICVIHVGRDGLSPAQLGAMLWAQLNAHIAERFAKARLTVPRALAGDGLPSDPDGWPFLTSRSDMLAAAPFVSVVICTRDRPSQLETCLNRLDQQQYPSFEVVVVDNAPGGDAVRAAVDTRGRRVPYHYIAEPRAGLSWARNTGIAASSGEIIAFLDDDDEPDRHWLAGLVSGFARNDRIGCVTGLILPARLDTPAQSLYEWLGGHHKGRGFNRLTFSRSGPQSPLYPLPPFGAGANMAFRREALISIGGFDVALGAGTPAFACEDTLAFTLTLLSGYDIAYEPTALMWHHHRRDLDSLRHQLHGYSVGLTAFYAALLRHRPNLLPELLRLIPTAIRYIRDPGVPALESSPELLTRLNRRHRTGLLIGPLAYIRSGLMQARVASSSRLPRMG